MENIETKLGKVTGDPMQKLSNLGGITRGCEFLGWEETHECRGSAQRMVATIAVLNQARDLHRPR